MKSGIYKITNTVTLQVYVGSAVNLARRIRTHRSYLSRGVHANRKLQNSWNKYGEASFVTSTLEQVEPLMLIEREQFWIDSLDAVTKGFNIRIKAESNLGLKTKPETIAKLRAIRHTPEMRAAKSARQMGHVVSAKTREKLSKAKIGRKMPPKSELARQKSRLTLTGKTFSDARKKAISDGKMAANARRRAALKPGEKFGPGSAVVADTFTPAICKVCAQLFRPKRSPKPTICGIECLRIWGRICESRKRNGAGLGVMYSEAPEKRSA